MKKPTVGIFKFTSDAGCQLQILNLEKELLELLKLIDIAYFPMASRNYGKGPFDIGFVEGAVTSTEEIIKIKEIREQCRILVALGSCACYGGIASIKNHKPQRELEERVYTDLTAVHSTKAYGIDQYVKVDAYVKGCPIDKNEFVEVVKSTLMEIKPNLRPHSVCVECKLREYPCIFLTEGKVCMGPVTSAGCGALCPSKHRACEGCRGPASDPNTSSLARTMMEYGLTPEEVRLKFIKYAGETQAFKEGAGVR
ncbi:MAG TPA: oxidoreductase [Peptococcaceae bacterium]|nr:MAG: NADH ubiquinone oxidoreductase-like protein (4: Predicted) [Clostridia bacterium 41_269]HBT20220.1 oxidoreductase [Peptococcaceae bacterium]